MRSRLLAVLVPVVGAVVVGGVVGVVGWSFLEVLRWATHTRETHGWLLFLLPAAGFVIGWTYHRWGGAARGGTPFVARQVLRRTEDVPARMAPMIYAGTAVGHLFGASVGREGAAVQISASITDSVARVFGLPERSRRVLLPASVAAAFGALLGTPFAGVVVAVSLQRRLRPLVVVCSLIAGFVGNRIVIACGYERETAPELPSVDWSVRWVAALVVVGVVCGVAARLFDLSMHRLRSRVAQLVAWPPLRPVVGGTATVVLALLVGRDYLGLSVPLLGDAFNGDAGWEDAAWKLVFTVIALATGFVGGEMVPLFVVGSALGAAVGTAFGLPVAVLVAVGFVTVFSAATTLTLFGIVAAVELFGWATLAPAVIAGLVARAIAGRPGLYLTKADLDQARDEL